MIFDKAKKIQKLMCDLEKYEKVESMLKKIKGYTTLDISGTILYRINNSSQSYKNLSSASCQRFSSTIEIDPEILLMAYEEKIRQMKLEIELL